MTDALGHPGNANIHIPVEDDGVPGTSLQAESERVLKALMASSPDAVIIIDESVAITEVNSTVSSLFGYQPDELFGRTIDMLLPECSRYIQPSHLDLHNATAEPIPMGLGLQLSGLRRTGDEFPVDVSIAAFFIGERRHVAAFIRDATPRRRNEFLLKFVNEVSQMVLSNQPTGDTLQHVSMRFRDLVDAATAYVAYPTDTKSIFISGACGREEDRLRNATVPDGGTLIEDIIHSGLPYCVQDTSVDAEVDDMIRSLDFGPGMFLPLDSGGNFMGALVALREHGDPVFSEQEISRASVFCSAIAVVKALGVARQELEVLNLNSTKENIVQELQSGVIHRLFSVGIHLDAIANLAPPEVLSDLDRSIAEIDGVIRQIRELVFNK